MLFGVKIVCRELYSVHVNGRVRPDTIYDPREDGRHSWLSVCNCERLED